MALAAQGFAEPRPTGRVDRRHVRKVLDRVGLIQIDSVNVLVRSQELPLFARLGPHPRDLIPKMLASGELFEFWAHEASLLPIETLSWFRWQMDAGLIRWPGIRRMAEEHPDVVDRIHAEVADRGPIAPSDIADREGKTGPWWGWDNTQRAFAVLFAQGKISARRRTNFEREYDLLHRMLPTEHVETPGLSELESRRAMILQAARSLGVATVGDLCDYYRLNVPQTRPVVAELVEEGRLVPVRVAGWKQPAVMDPEARWPRRVQARALLSPFDSLIWNRDRAERLFAFRYRIEIYVPAPKRVHGYYVLPFLLGDRLVARVDLKADRAARVLRVRGAFGEDPVPSPEVAEELAAELTLMADWLGLDGVSVDSHGDLAPALAAASDHSGVSNSLSARVIDAGMERR
ncbi:MAG: YcaQ family DNA glycosylase [Acidimicrobiia bacterium]|nr:YcaQ family DNA glycosylase [Acidimicrobiia bacterium]